MTAKCTDHAQTVTMQQLCATYGIELGEVERRVGMQSLKACANCSQLVIERDKAEDRLDTSPIYTIELD